MGGQSFHQAQSLQGPSYHIRLVTKAKLLKNPGDLFVKAQDRNGSIRILGRR